MRKFLFLLIIMVPFIGQAQLTALNGIVLSSLDGSRFEAAEVTSKYDTVILYKGIKHNHHFVSERKPVKTISCLVNHGPEGCPEDWTDIKQICTICLRHIHIKETRITKPKPDEYQEAFEALERLHKLKSQ